MYCPRCAAENLEGAKFCRACGINLEVVALALTGRQPPAEAGKGEADAVKAEKSWMEKRSEGTGGIIRGTGLLVASLLVGIALWMFSNEPDWIMVWVIFAGWMAVWGVISLTSGIHALTESRFMRRQMADETAGARLPALPSGVPAMLPEAQVTSRLTPPPSVTEGTTELLKAEKRGGAK
jgi:zinc-ribbon domain